MRKLGLTRHGILMPPSRTPRRVLGLRLDYAVLTIVLSTVVFLGGVRLVDNNLACWTAPAAPQTQSCQWGGQLLISVTR
jgi:hypothetical protein